MGRVVMDRLVKVFPGGTRAVDEVSLTVEAGELFVLLGPSGCGKTTTLRCVAGLERQTSGDIRIGDRLVNHLAPADRDIAFVFQFYALYPHLTAYDNMAFPLRAARMPPAEVDARVRQVARLLRIEHTLRRIPGQLSGGEQQRVALGRAIVRRPQVYLMDEPLTNLDASLRADVRVELKHLQQQLGTTTLYVTHDQTEAMSLGHRVAVMNRGKLEQVGTPLEVYHHPASLFVASFIGSPPMNLVDVVLDRGPALVNPAVGFRLAIPLPQADGLPWQLPMRLGVRCEDLRLCPDPAAGDLTARVQVREPLGDENIYGVQLGNGCTMLARTPHTLRLEVGTVVGVSFDKTRLHLFDVVTGKALR